MTTPEKLSTSRKASIFLLRHGEPIGGPRYRGSTDDPLSDLGWQQMHNAIASAGQWQKIVSSPLQRCFDFSRRLSNSLDIPLQQENDFSEINFGEWEGQTAEQLWRHDQVRYANYLSDPLLHTPPKGEALQNFSQRVLSAWNKLTLQVQDQEIILLVAHGGTIRIILHHLLGMPLASIMKIHVPFASVSKIGLEYADNHPVQYRLAYHNVVNNIVNDVANIDNLEMVESGNNE